MRSSRRERGFTLLEVLVATALMALAVVTLVEGLSNSLFNAQRLTERDRAAQLARQKMDELLLDTRLPKRTVLEGPFEPAQAGGLQAGWRARVTTFEYAPGSPPNSPALDRVELEVWWLVNDQRKAFTLEGYRRGRLLPEDISAPGMPLPVPVPGAAR